MNVYEAMRTTFAAREYTNDPVDDATLYRLLDNARFAPSGGNRQGWKVIIVRDAEKRASLKTMMQPTANQYVAQMRAGEVPFNTITPTALSSEELTGRPVHFPLIDDLEHTPILLIICVDLTQVTSFDKDLDRVGVISGASIYPFAWNILLAARNEGLGGVLTTFLAHSEVEARDLLNLPDHFAVAAMLGIGTPLKQLTRLKREPVEHFTRIDAWDGPVFTGDDA